MRLRELADLFRPRVASRLWACLRLHDGVVSVVGTTHAGREAAAALGPGTVFVLGRANGDFQSEVRDWLLCEELDLDAANAQVESVRETLLAGALEG